MPHSQHSPSPSPPETEGFVDLPPFPDNVPTAPLLRISLAKLTSQDEAEQERCWRACQSLGFFYLDLRGCAPGTALLSDADALFELMKTFYALPVEEKVRYDFKKEGSYFGYKGYGEGIIDKEGRRDKNEFYNVSKDDVLGLSAPLPAPECLRGGAEPAAQRASCEGRGIGRAAQVGCGKRGSDQVCARAAAGGVYERGRAGRAYGFRVRDRAV